MASGDWTSLADEAASINQGVTVGIAVPNGGGSFTYGFHSQSTAIGAAGLFTNQANFAPTAKGARVQGAVKRHPSAAGTTLFAPFLFACLQGVSNTDVAYMLGLSDASPSKIILRKGALDGGFPSEVIAPTTTGILAIGTANKAEGDWVHLRLDVVVNLNGDVVLNVFESDLDEDAVTAPDFDPVPGMDTLAPGTGRAFVDDVLGVNTGSVPFIVGRHGFGFHTAAVNRRAFFDHVEIARQL